MPGIMKAEEGRKAGPGKTAGRSAGSLAGKGAGAVTGGTAGALGGAVAGSVIPGVGTAAGAWAGFKKGAQQGSKWGGKAGAKAGGAIGGATDYAGGFGSTGGAAGSGPKGRNQPPGSVQQQRWRSALERAKSGSQQQKSPGAFGRGSGNAKGGKYTQAYNRALEKVGAEVGAKMIPVPVAGRWLGKKMGQMAAKNPITKYIVFFSMGMFLFFTALAITVIISVIAIFGGTAGTIADGANSPAGKLIRGLTGAVVPGAGLVDLAIQTSGK